MTRKISRVNFKLTAFTPPPPHLCKLNKEITVEISISILGQYSTTFLADPKQFRQNLQVIKLKPPCRKKTPLEHNYVTHSGILVASRIYKLQKYRE